ncbi:MAG: helix-turn-helix domain-containing protein [Desulfobacteraceae bacterium]|jgi:curved DNA-binding protein CbpA
MKKFEDLSYYEILEIPVGASSYEIREAYKEALSIYNEDSLTTYSLFTDDERDEIREKVEEAFLTLIDEVKRADYDRMLVDSGRVDEQILHGEQRGKTAQLFAQNKVTYSNAVSNMVRKKIEERDVGEMASEILSEEWISGSDLKRLREAVGIKQEEVFEITRITVSVLDAIENDQVENLPPLIYLKNFLKQYAEILQLDSEKIIKGYTRHIAHSQDKTLGEK